MAAGQSIAIDAFPQRELRPPYLFEIDCEEPRALRVECITIGTDLLGAGWASSAMSADVLRERELDGPCVLLGQPIRVTLRNDSCNMQQVNVTLLTDTIPDELRGLGCVKHRHRVRNCDACEERKKNAGRYSNTLAVAQKPSRAALTRAISKAHGLLDFPPMASPMSLESDDLFGYDDNGYLAPLDDNYMEAPRPSSGRYGFPSATVRRLAAMRPPLGAAFHYTQDAAGLRRAALDVIGGKPEALSLTELDELLTLLISEHNRRSDRAGISRARLVLDPGPVLPPLPPLQVDPPRYVTCLNVPGAGAHCGVCSLCVERTKLEQPPAPAPPPPPPEVPPAKGPEFDRQQKEPAHDGTPERPRLRVVDGIEFTSMDPTATPTRAGLRALEEHRYAALVSEFEAWESAADEYP